MSTLTDFRPQLAAAYSTAVAVAGATRPEQLGDPTPCREMDVAALVDHLVFAARRAARLGHGDALKAELTAPQVELDVVVAVLEAAAADATAGWSDDESRAW